MAEVFIELDVLEGPEVEIGPDDEDDIDLGLESSYWDTHTHFIMSGTEDIQQPIEGAGPNQDIYEVDKILDGPRKRREHNYQKCYKIRWKHFGKEADSWQPVSDLENVMYMVHEFDHKRAEQHKTRKPKGELMEGEMDTDLADLAENNNNSEATALEAGGGEESELFGSLKDRFWKKLEMGLYDETVFDGDMYSKVKGSRRAAHADAATNIQKMQHQRQNQKSPSALSPKMVGRGSSRFKQECREGGKASATSSSSPSSGDNISVRPPHLGGARKTRKRSSEPFSARGYMSAKRSRRSREQKRPSISSVTLGIISLPLRDPVDSNGESQSVVSNGEPEPVVPNGEAVVPNSEPAEEDRQEAPEDVQHTVNVPIDDDGGVQRRRPPFYKLDSGYGDEADVVFKTETETKMTVTSETLLTVTTDCRRLDTDNVIQPEEIIKLQSDDNFLPDPRSHIEDLASAAAEGQALSSPASGAFETCSSSAQRSTLDTLSEAMGAVERSHSEECLWGGACNRSDCKSNRRWNMKNGRGQIEEKVSSSSNNTGNSDSTSTGNGSSSTTGSTSSVYRTGSGVSSVSSLSNSRTQSDNSPLARRTSSSTGQPLPRRPAQSFSTGQRERSLVSSSHSPACDSAPDRNASQNKRDVTGGGAFDHMDALAHRMHMDAIESSSANRELLVKNSRNSLSGRSTMQTVVGDSLSHGSSNSRERPGLFSDSFSFISGNSSMNRDMPSAAGLSEASSLNPTIPSPSGSTNLSSPGKENFSTRGWGKNDHNSVGPSGQDRFTSSSGVESESRREPVSSSSEQTHEMMDFISSTDSWSQRKRGGENSQPLEKIPSPNSRKVSDLDQRVLTNTCDELDDMEIQGEDHKDKTLITNADLFQAVNLNKGEVVRRAIKQSADTAPKLDFEQPDGNGLTLLMRAVQKSSIAIVEMLIENGANVNAQQANGTTPLMMAVEQREICVVALLLKHGANSSLCTAGSDQGETALIKAIRRQNKDAVSLMLRTGVNFSSPDCTNVSALEVAVERRNPQIEGLVRSHIEKMVGAFEERVSETLQDTAQLLDKLFPVQCFPLRESQTFTVRFSGSLQPLPIGEGFLLFIAHTKINDRGVRCRFHGTCPIDSVSLNGVVQSPLTKEVNFVTSCHPVISGCNTLVINKHPDYLSKAKLLVCAYHARLLARV